MPGIDRVGGRGPSLLRIAVVSESQVFKKRSALVERADDFRHPNHAVKRRRKRQAGLEHRLRTGSLDASFAAVATQISCGE